MSYHCSICGYIYDDATQSTPFSELPDTWQCPICSMGKNVFVKKEAPAARPVPASSPPANNQAAAVAPTASTAPSSSSSNAKQSPTASTKSDILIQQLENCGLKWIFGMVGHSNLGIAEALRQSNPDQQDSGIRFIGIRHEGAASFAAAAYGKLTGRPAGCLSIAGPGATNMSTGIADALLDRAPLLALMGQVPSNTLDLNVFQELKLDACFAPLTHAQYTLHPSSSSARLAQQAYQASAHNKVPVQIILPDDTQKQSADESDTTLPCSPPLASPSEPSHDSILAAAHALQQAKNPLIIVGHGAQHALDETRELAELLQAPLCTTYRAKGYISDSHPLACGVIGLSGTPISHHFSSEADLILTLGVGFARHSAIPHSDRNGQPKTLIRIDHDAQGARPLPLIDHQLIGDTALCLRQLITELQQRDELASTSPGIQSKVERIALEWELWRKEKAQRATPSADAPTAISPAAACEALNALLPERAIISVDVGNVAYQVGRYLESHCDQRYLLSWYLGSIGVGLPSAIGAYAATCEDGPWKDRPVIAIVGDGGLGQYLAEITTIAKYQIPLKIVVFNNSQLGKITREQTQASYPTWETDLINPDFAHLANSSGIEGITISSASELTEKLSQAFSHQRPSLINILTDPNAN